MEALGLDGFAHGIGMKSQLTGDGADFPMLGVKVATDLHTGFGTEHANLTSVVEYVGRD
jgi:hypothetical protein